MSRYKCIIIEDEPLAQNILKRYIADHPSLELAAVCNDAMEAQTKLTRQTIDLLFLDINLPKLSGINFIKTLLHPPLIIFTTAYPEYAVEGFELNAVDYLLKPFSFERFTKAVYKAVDTIKKSQSSAGNKVDDKKPPFFIKSDGKNYPVSIDDILYCEAMKNYTMVRLKDGQKLMPLIPLSKFEIVLAEAGGDFIQVHRSFLLSKKHITAVAANQVSINKYEIPIGVQYKEKFYRAIGMKDNQVE